MPMISVLMPVYNAELFLREAIESILNQTFADFEFIIIDDGSTDRSFEIAKSYNDPRIRLYQNDKNLKISATLNKGLQLATGDYLARMDADDISHHERLQKQYDFLETHPDIDICGAGIQFFGAKITKWLPPQTHQEIRDLLLSGMAMVHPLLMFRKQVYKTMSYSQEYIGIEDYFLISDLLHSYKAHNLQEILLDYRITGSQSSFDINTDGVVQQNNRQKMMHFDIVKMNLRAIYSDKMPKVDIQACEDIFTRKNILTKEYLNSYESYIRFLLESNSKYKIYTDDAIVDNYVSNIVRMFSGIKKSNGKIAVIRGLFHYFLGTSIYKKQVLKSLFDIVIK